MIDAAQLEELRALFRDEALDGLAALERILVALDAAGPTPRAGQEAFRLVHGIKGAARAAQELDLEADLHALETSLAALRQAGYADTAAVHELVRRAVARLRAWVDGGAEDTAEAPPSAPREPPAAAALRVRASLVLDLLAASDEALAAVGDGESAVDVVAAEEHAFGELLQQIARLVVVTEDSTVDRHDIRASLGRVVRASQAAAQARRGVTAQRERSWRRVRTTVSDVAQLVRGLGATPLDQLTGPLVAAAHEVADELGRAVDVECQLGALELDRRIVDGLREPLLHLLRNAIDHGVEPPEERVARGKPARGRITIAGGVRGSELHLTIADDGRGFDLSALRAAAAAAGVELGDGSAASVVDHAFLPGVTTRAEATSFSGRGVGLDAVRDRIGQLHGRLHVSTEAGVGASVRIVVPTSLSVMRALLVVAAGTRWAVGAAGVERLGRASWDEVTTLEGRTYLRLEGALVPVVALAEVLTVAARENGDGARGKWPFVVVGTGERRVALRVDDLVDEREVVVRSLGPRVRRVAFVAGAIVGERGDATLLLDAGDLAAAARPGRLPEANTPRARRRVLVVDDSLTTRQLERAMLEAAGYDVIVAEDGARAWITLETERVDLVVSDIEMPAMDGFQLLARIRASGALGTLPVVLVTALADEADRRRALDLGANAYVLKSRFDQEELLELLASLA